MSSDKEQNEDAESGPEENPDKEETPSGATEENSENQDNKYIKLKVIGNDQNGIHFKLKTSTALIKLKKSYSTSVGIPVSALRFLFDGKRISDDDTPKALDMRDDDQIEVYQEQTGGRWLSFS